MLPVLSTLAVAEMHFSCTMFYINSSHNGKYHQVFNETNKPIKYFKKKERKKERKQSTQLKALKIIVLHLMYLVSHAVQVPLLVLFFWKNLRPKSLIHFGDLIPNAKMLPSIVLSLQEGVQNPSDSCLKCLTPVNFIGSLVLK